MTCREIKPKFSDWKSDLPINGGRNVFTATEEKIEKLEAENKELREALHYLQDSVEWNGDATERMVYDVCSTALKGKE